MRLRLDPRIKAMIDAEASMFPPRVLVFVAVLRGYEIVQSDAIQLSSLEEVDALVAIPGLGAHVGRAISAEPTVIRESSTPVQPPNLVRQAPGVGQPLPDPAYQEPLQPATPFPVPSRELTPNQPRQITETTHHENPAGPGGNSPDTAQQYMPPNRDKRGVPGPQPREDSPQPGGCTKPSAYQNIQTVLNQGVPASYRGQCTEWADGRYFQLTGRHVDFVQGHIDALGWPEAAPTKGWKVSTTPSAPSMVVFQPQPGMFGATGHVAVVESISGNMLCTSNWNLPTLGVTTMKTFDVSQIPDTVRYISH